jgi:hypothetical protein
MRHQILKVLNKKLNSNHELTIKRELNNSNMKIDDLLKELNMPYQEFQNCHLAMHFAKENQLKCTVNDNGLVVGLEEAGVAAFVDDYWLREGNKDLNERIYDKTKWLIPLLALLITATSLTYAAYTTQQNSKKVQSIELELQRLKQTIKPQPYISIPQNPLPYKQHH